MKRCAHGFEKSWQEFYQHCILLGCYKMLQHQHIQKRHIGWPYWKQLLQDKIHIHQHYYSVAMAHYIMTTDWY